uniref:Uncharacterized protein n=1 Tax=Oltmannsiellopsis viridis TaxID=51324 RepID=Q20F19_OLTVI|nr:hypothetical protein OlviCp005 [Oltmannsiellopsis viridis]ABB81987.1 hypothetical protein [Oltmannsiellopsis viridis]
MEVLRGVGEDCYAHQHFTRGSVGEKPSKKAKGVAPLFFKLHSAFFEVEEYLYAPFSTFRMGNVLKGVAFLFNTPMGVSKRGRLFGFMKTRLKKTGLSLKTC